MEKAVRVVARAVKELEMVRVEAETAVATAVVATAEVRAVGDREMVRAEAASRRWW